MKKFFHCAVIALALVVMLFAVAGDAQGPSTIQPQPALTPFDPTPLAQQLAQQSTWTAWAGNSISTLGTNQSNDESKIAAHDAAIASIQNQLNAQAQLISALQAALSKVTTPAPTSSTLTFTACPDGPLNGNYQGVNFSTGFWICSGGELVPAADGQPQRSFIFPKAVTITNVTWSSANITRTQALVLTSASGQRVSVTAIAANQDASFSPGWTMPTLSFTVSATPNTASAPDIRIRSVAYQ